MIHIRSGRECRCRAQRRGELASQLFVYILGIIVIGLVLLLGYRAVGHTWDKKCEVQEVQFQTALSSAIEKDKTGGVSRIETFEPPCGAVAVCFVDRDVTDSMPDANGNLPSPSPFDAPIDVNDPSVTFRTAYPIITGSVEGGDDTNVFIRTDDGYEPLELFSKAAPIDLPGGPVRCIDVPSGDPLHIRMKGLSRAVEPVPVG